MNLFARVARRAWWTPVPRTAVVAQDPHTFVTRVSKFTLIDISAVDTIPQHSQRAFSALKTLFSGWVIEARNAGKTGLEATEVLNSTHLTIFHQTSKILDFCHLHR